MSALYKIGEACKNNDPGLAKDLYLAASDTERHCGRLASSALNDAAKYNHVDFVRWLVCDEKASMDYFSTNALVSAARGGSLEVLQFLVLKAGEGTTVQCTREEPLYPRTLLLVAVCECQPKHLEVVRWLLASGVSNISEVFRDGTNAFIGCVETCENRDAGDPNEGAVWMMTWLRVLLLYADPPRRLISLMQRDAGWKRPLAMVRRAPTLRALLVARAKALDAFNATHILPAGVVGIVRGYAEYVEEEVWEDPPQCFPMFAAGKRKRPQTDT
jgi:hypothetical protein